MDKQFTTIDGMMDWLELQEKDEFHIKAAKYREIIKALDSYICTIEDEYLTAICAENPQEAIESVKLRHKL